MISLFFIQWEESSLDLPIPGKIYEKRIHGFQTHTHLATSITSQAHWNDFITAPYKKITLKFYFFFGLSSFISFSPRKILFPNCYQKRVLSCEAVHLRSHAQYAVWIKYTNDSSSSYCDKHIVKRLHSQAPICYITWNTIPWLHTIKSPRLQSMIGLHIA